MMVLCFFSNVFEKNTKSISNTIYIEIKTKKNAPKKYTKNV